MRKPVIGRYVKILGAVGGSVCLAAIAVTFVALVITVRSDGRGLAALRESITANRVTNVATWCNAINADRRRNRDLPQLDCLTIEANTLKSNH